MQVQNIREHSRKIVHESLEITRKNLLDFSRKNRLLNFKHTSTKILRFINQSPNSTYAELIATAEDEKKGILIAPVPLPKRIDYADIANADLKKIDVKTHAQRLGFDIDFEIMPSIETSNIHHTDNLQTLHFPEECDRIVRRIQAEARTAIEESGVNILFLCLGFLKWTDHEDSETHNYAPLIMVPVEIQRDKVDAKTGFAKFRLKYTNEDILDNICLREKLNQFSISLPLFDEFDTPEDYFSALSEQLSDIKPDWSVHRYITLSFLSFGKMLMYLDLDPARWPESESFENIKHIRDIFSGNHSNGEALASEFDIDDQQNIPNLPFVMDADSSQHSAIIDVLNGRNVVIEGPPGTGKSQTIVNLIAACLAKGKNVLFVAEKSAALEVVRKRLNNIGLGNFCLELHSHKTQKKALLSDLKKRLEMNTASYYASTELAELRLHELNSKKIKLIEYAKAINTPFGQINQTPHEIFWKTEVLQSKCTQAYQPNNFPVPNAVVTLSARRLSEQLDTIQNFADNLRHYFQSNDFTKDHYWHGLNFRNPMEYAQQIDTFNLLKKLYTTASSAKESILKLADFGIDSFAIQRNEIEDQLTQSDFTHSKYYDFFDLSNAQNTINDCLMINQRYKTHFENFQTTLKKFKLNIGALELLDAGKIREIQLPKQIPLFEIRSIIEFIRPAYSDFIEVKSFFNEAKARLEIFDDLNSPEISSIIVHVSNLCSKIDTAVLKYRHPIIENLVNTPLVNQLFRTIQNLREQKDVICKNFNFDVLPNLDRLQKLATILSKKRTFLNIFSSERRNAIKEYIKIARNDQAKDLVKSVEKLNIIITYLKEVEKLNQNAVYQNMLSELFKGIDTDIEQIQTAINFYQEIKTHLSQIDDCKKFYNIIHKMNEEQFNWFRQNTTSLLKGAEGLKKAIIKIQEIQNRRGNTNDIELLISEFDRCEKLLNQIDVSISITLKDISGLIDEYEALEQQKKIYLSNTTMKNLGFTPEEEHLPHQNEILSTIYNTFLKVKKIFPQTGMQYILCPNGFENLQVIVKLQKNIGAYQENLSKFYQLLESSKKMSEFWQNDTNNEIELMDAIIKKLKVLDQKSSSFSAWCEVLNGFDNLKEFNLYTIITSFIDSDTYNIPFSDYKPLYHFLVYYTLSDEILRKNKILGSFARITHENIRQSFRGIDLELQKLNAQKLARDLNYRQIPEGCSGRSPKEFTGKRLINHEIGKQKSHISIRKLVNQAYDALIALKPCFLMSPLSVAQYLPPGKVKFDILIMDEASQVKPEDAIGVLARTNQVVIVGDSNQLPPTGFFNMIGVENEEEETTIESSESILDVCKSLFQPLRRLRWHYRSQHQSLISFSNHHFYDNDLIIFPSSTAHSEILGVKHVYVPNGIYSSQCNFIEAQRIVEEIVEMIQQKPHLSYGIVTFNINQKKVIDDIIERVRKNNPIFDQYYSDSDHSDERLFVKNLESVQGDERDVIFISTTFGLDEKGVFRQNFGPLNGKDGWRRLNVLFTRAKQHIRIFSSFMPERIQIDDTKEQRGLKALKDYLNFAITGFDNHTHFTNQEPDSDFERAVGSFLHQKGYEVVYQLGVAGYRIDLVVKHPKCPTDYLIAVECDGASYHSARSARDRDRLREENLRKLGWTHIHRIWSTDWFRHRTQEESRLLNAITKAMEDRTKSI